MPHWHAQNPWRDRLVYVTLEELAECVAGGTVRLPDESVVPYDKAFVLAWFNQAGDKLDAYIIPHKFHSSCGVRYGPDGPQYLSPHGNQEKVSALLKKMEIAPDG